MLRIAVWRASDAHRVCAVVVAMLLGTLLASPAGAVSTRVLVAGDSITDGVVSEPFGLPYTELLPDLLGPDFELQIAGRGGLSTHYLRPDVPCGFLCDEDTFFESLLAPALPTDVTTLMLGLNDALGFFLDEPTSPAAYETNLRDILDAIFLDGSSHIVLMSPPTPAAAAHLADDFLVPYRDAVFTICRDTVSVLCGPDLQRLLDPDDDFEPGDIHPNGQGHAKIASALADKIQAIPEPGTATLLAIGLIALSQHRRTRRSGTRPGRVAPER